MEQNAEPATISAVYVTMYSDRQVPLTVTSAKNTLTLTTK